jgi:hypothetical protein
MHTLYTKALALCALRLYNSCALGKAKFSINIEVCLHTYAHACTSQHRTQNASKEYDLPAAQPAEHATAVHARTVRSKSLDSADDFSSDAMLLTSQAIAVGAGALQLTSTSVASPGSSVRKHRQHSNAVVAGSSLVTSSIKVRYW